MPFARGEVVLCEQGNAPRLGTHSRASPQNTYALDFSNRALETVEVVAAAPGTVAYVLSGAPDDDFDYGAGYGNQVRVAHADGYFTLYAHLDTVTVRVGSEVDAGDVIGTMGQTARVRTNTCASWFGAGAKPMPFVGAWCVSVGCESQRIGSRWPSSRAVGGRISA
jgi:hypothetical protein